MKVTNYFKATRERPDSSIIRDEWILGVISEHEKTEVQIDGRVKRWAKIEEAGGKYLRVITLPDGKTVHNAFFDRKMVTG